jgi:uncharacterized protein (TIGR02300 family)
MAGKDLGNKHLCFKCGTKFYDFKKSEPLCPKCGSDQRQSPALKAPPAERRQKAPPRAAPEEAERTVDDEVEVDDAEADEDEEKDDKDEEEDDA